jgi:recombination protein RecT
LSQALTITNVGKMFDNYAGDLQKIALPGMDSQRFAAGILQAFRKQPALLSCNPETIKTAIFDAAAIGIIPGVGERPLGYLIAYGKDCAFQLSYFGRLYLMRKFANLVSFRLAAVFEGDHFKVEYNQIGSFWEHTPKAMDTSPEKLTHVWIEGTFKGADGIERAEFHYITRADVERVRQKSRQKDVGPWKNDYVPMAIKTCINQFAKYKQTSPIVKGAVRREEYREQVGGSQWDIDATWEPDEGDAAPVSTQESGDAAPADGKLPGMTEANPVPATASAGAKAIGN